MPFTAMSLEVLGAFTTALTTLSRELPLPTLSDGEREALRPSVGRARAFDESMGALRFAPQVARHTGVSADALAEALAQREALLQLRDTALRLALSASELLTLFEEPPSRDREAHVILERARRGQPIDPVVISQAIAAHRADLDEP